MAIPLMLNLKGKNALIIGGGNIAYRKIQSLLKAEMKITCISPRFNNKISHDTRISCIKSIYESKYLDNIQLVISATDDVEVNNRVYNDCRKRNCLCMTVDKKNPSDFSFMATREMKNLVIAVSTYGESPMFSKYLAEHIINNIENEQLELLEKMIIERKEKLNRDV